MRPSKIYRHLIDNNIFGIADKIKTERKSLKNRRNARNNKRNR